MEPDIGALFAAADRGDPSASRSLFAALYAELHKLASRELTKRGSLPSLGATTLLHEAYLDMTSRAETSFPDRNRFMGYAARVMRGLIVDHARERRAAKRGGRFEITSLGTEVAENVADARELSDISDALDELARIDPALAQIVDLRFFCGFSFAEIAAMRGISMRTAQRLWERARVYLHERLRGQQDL